MDKWQAEEFLIATSFCFSCFKWFDSLKVLSGFGLINAFTLINFKNAQRDKNKQQPKVAAVISREETQNLVISMGSRI